MFTSDGTWKSNLLWNGAVLVGPGSWSLVLCPSSVSTGHSTRETTALWDCCFPHNKGSECTSPGCFEKQNQLRGDAHLKSQHSRGQGQVGLQIQGQPVLQSYFQNSQVYLPRGKKIKCIYTYTFIYVGILKLLALLPVKAWNCYQKHRQTGKE